MANFGHGKKFEQMKEKLLAVAQKEFFLKGYKNTKIADVCKIANADNNAVARVFCDKETLFLSVIEQVIKEQNKIAKKIIGNKKDSLLEYFLQHATKLIFSSLSAKSAENFSVYYERRKTSVDKRLYDKLQDSLPKTSKEDFYACLIAIDGIMRNFICAYAFDKVDKVDKFTSFALNLLNIENERAKQIIDFIKAKETISKLKKQSLKLLQQITGD